MLSDILKCFKPLSLRHLHLKEDHYLFWFGNLALKWGLKFGGKQNTFKHHLWLRKFTNSTYLNMCMNGVLYSCICNRFIINYTYFNPIANEVTTKISLPAEAIYWQELGDGRILTVWKESWYTNCRAPIVHRDFNSFYLAIRSCNANDLISKFSARLEKKKKRKCLQLLTLSWFEFFTLVSQKQQKSVLFLLGTE